VAGAYRFLRRLWKAVHAHLARGPVAPLDRAGLTGASRALHRKTHATIAKVSDDFDRRQTFNTAIAAVMELLNDITRLDPDAPQGAAVEREALEAAVLLLAPVVPHITQALWRHLGHGESLVDAPWPIAAPEALEADR